MGDHFCLFDDMALLVGKVACWHLPDVFRRDEASFDKVWREKWRLSSDEF